MNQKHIFTLLFLLSFVLNSFAQEKLIEESESKIKNEIAKYIYSNLKSSKTVKYEIEDGVKDTTADLISTSLLDKEKNEFIETVVSPSYSKTVNKFDEKGNITDITIYYENGYQMSKLKTEYNEYGKAKERKYYFGESFTFKINYNYDEQNNITKLIYSDTMGILLSTSYFEYDKKGNILSENKYNQLDSLEISYEYKYDAKGNCIKETTTIPNISLSNIKKYVYDKKGNLIQSSESKSNGNELINEVTYKYDKENRLIQESNVKKAGAVPEIKNYFYNDSGRLERWTFKDTTENIESEYDISYELF